MIGQTIPHEVAHIVVHQLYGSYHKGNRVWPHGKEWKFVIQIALDVPAKRCHNHCLAVHQKIKRRMKNDK